MVSVEAAETTVVCSTVAGPETTPDLCSLDLGATELITVGSCPRHTPCLPKLAQNTTIKAVASKTPIDLLEPDQFELMCYLLWFGSLSVCCFPFESVYLLPWCRGRRVAGCLAFATFVLRREGTEQEFGADCRIRTVACRPLASRLHLCTSPSTSFYSNNSTKRKSKNASYRLSTNQAIPVCCSHSMASIPRYRKLLGGSIRELRKKADFTQEKLAELAELHPKYVGEVERGEKTISVDALVRLAKALSVRLRDLVRDV